MLVEESMSLLWASYYAISLLVFVAVYLTFIILPRFLRLLLTWIIAGAMWAPARFSLPLVEEGEFYTGWAPAAMVAAVGFLENNTSAFKEGLLWLLLGVTLGALIGLAIWWLRRPSPDARADAASQTSTQAAEDTKGAQRQEPVL
ncbi:hypothetical protein HLB35_11810 [Halomonas sp. TBZ9]|uniref:Uncharacterized protein n=1 Tax=Vreelandella azerica TaxID=2732867 RepID=A0A7Y3TZE6_9GAMM|nr:hypothetical protein [Halomonas azerica]NOG32272.1 hypothetical protein [Halomonas azerica]